MKKLRFIPAALLPYLVLASIAVLFWSDFIMQKVFASNAFNLIAALLVITPISVAVTLWAVISAIIKRSESASLAKTAMLIKLIQIPAYLVIFVLGAILLLTVFTFAISIAFYIFDCIAISMTGLIGAAAAFRAFREGKISFVNALVLGVCQFIFCADVIAVIILYRKIKKLESNDFSFFTI